MINPSNLIYPLFGLLGLALWMVILRAVRIHNAVEALSAEDRHMFDFGWIQQKHIRDIYGFEHKRLSPGPYLITHEGRAKLAWWEPDHVWRLYEGSSPLEGPVYIYQVKEGPLPLVGTRIPLGSL